MNERYPSINETMNSKSTCQQFFRVYVDHDTMMFWQVSRRGQAAQPEDGTFSASSLSIHSLASPTRFRHVSSHGCSLSGQSFPVGHCDCSDCAYAATSVVPRVDEPGLRSSRSICRTPTYASSSPWTSTKLIRIFLHCRLLLFFLLSRAVQNVCVLLTTWYLVCLTRLDADSVREKWCASLISSTDQHGHHNVLCDLFPSGSVYISSSLPTRFSPVQYLASTTLSVLSQQRPGRPYPFISSPIWHFAFLPVR